MLKLKLFAAGLAALGLSLSAATAADAQRPSPPRPAMAAGASTADALAKNFAAGLAAIMAAEIAAHDRFATSAANPFRKPRPRPAREQMLAPQAKAPARSA